MKVAVTLVFCVMLTVQDGFVPLQAPPQLENVQPAEGVAISVTFVPLANESLQVPVLDEQLIPFGELVTVPLPVSLTCSV